MNNKEAPYFDWKHYNPQSLKESQPIPSMVPNRVFKEGEYANFQPQMFPNGLIVINIVHIDYPDAVCQVQMVPEESVDRHYNVFFLHGSPTEHYIPDLLAEKIALTAAIPQTIAEIDKMFRNGPVV